MNSTTRKNNNDKGSRIPDSRSVPVVNNLDDNLDGNIVGCGSCGTKIVLCCFLGGLCMAIVSPLVLGGIIIGGMIAVSVVYYIGYKVACNVNNARKAQEDQQNENSI